MAHVFPSQEDFSPQSMKRKSEKQFQGTHGMTLLSKLNRDRHSESSFCDVIITVGGQDIKAHKNVLAMCSDFFADMFREEADESNLASALEELDPSSVQTIIDYIYTAHMTMTRDNALQLMDAANVLCMPDVKQFCMSYLNDFMAARSVKKPRKQHASSVKHYSGSAGRLLLTRTAVRKPLDSVAFDSASDSGSPEEPLRLDVCIKQETPEMTVEVQSDQIDLHDLADLDCEPSSSSSVNAALGQTTLAYHKEMSALRSDAQSLHFDRGPVNNLLFGSFLSTAQVLNILIDPNRSCVSSIPEGRKENAYFVVENPGNHEKPRVGIQHILSHDSNQWQAKSHAFAYFLEQNHKFTEVRKYQNLICKRNPRHNKYTPFDPQPDENSVIKLAKTVCVSVFDENYRRRITYLERLPDGCKPIFIAEYSSPVPTDT